LADLDVAYYGWNDREEGEIIESIDLFDSIASDAARVVFR
jgi:hypothetical protein